MSLLVSSALLTGCSSDDSAALEVSGNSVPTPTTLAIYSGSVLDGYISGATVCLDIDNNSACDSNEPQAKTDDKGIYRFELSRSISADTLAKARRLAIIPVGAKDISNGHVFDKEVRLLAPASAAKEAVISPFTTLVQGLIEQQALSRADAESKLAKDLNLPEAVLSGDYIKQANAVAQNQAVLLTMWLSESNKSDQAPAHIQLLQQLKQPAALSLLQKIDHAPLSPQQAKHLVQLQQKTNPSPVIPTTPEKPTTTTPTLTPTTPPTPGSPVTPAPTTTPKPSEPTKSDPLSAFKSGSYLKLAENGQTLPATATDWYCVQDNRADSSSKGAIWLRLNFTESTGIFGSKTLTIREQLKENQLSDFIANANSKKWCGRSDWHLPSLAQLHSLNEKTFQYRNKDWQGTLDMNVFDDQARLAALPDGAARPHYWTANYEANALKIGMVERLLYRHAWFSYFEGTDGEGGMAQDQQRSANGGTLPHYTLARLVAAAPNEPSVLTSNLEQHLAQTRSLLVDMQAKADALRQLFASTQTINSPTKESISAQVVALQQALYHWKVSIGAPDKALMHAESLFYQRESDPNPPYQKLPREDYANSAQLIAEITRISLVIKDAKMEQIATPQKITDAAKALHSIRHQATIDLQTTGGKINLDTAKTGLNKLRDALTLANAATLQAAMDPVQPLRMQLAKQLLELEALAKLPELNTAQQQSIAAMLAEFRRMLSELDALLPQAAARLNALQATPKLYQLLKADGSTTSTRSEAACAKVIGNEEEMVWMLTDHTLSNKAGASIKGNDELNASPSYYPVDTAKSLQSMKFLPELANLQKLCGYNDWQLPTTPQLATLLDGSGIKDASVFTEHESITAYWVRDPTNSYNTAAATAPFTEMKTLKSSATAKARLLRFVRVSALIGMDALGAPLSKKPICFKHKSSGKTWYLAHSSSSDWVKDRWGISGAQEWLGKTNQAGQCGLAAGWKLPSAADVAALDLKSLEKEDQSLSGLSLEHTYWLSSQKLFKFGGGKLHCEGPVLEPQFGCDAKVLLVHD